jgi:hypothetical protein
MDESHLNAPTAHGNTADLPTALASIIGLAGMETRVDHGDPGAEHDQSPTEEVQFALAAAVGRRDCATARMYVVLRSTAHGPI